VKKAANVQVMQAERKSLGMSSLVGKLVSLLSNGQTAMTSIATCALTNGKLAYQAAEAASCPVFAPVKRHESATQRPSSNGFYGFDWNIGTLYRIRGGKPQAA
jgi:hypothetical protein